MPQGLGAIAAFQPDRRRVGFKEVRHQSRWRGCSGRHRTASSAATATKAPAAPIAQPVLRIDAGLHRVDGPAGGDPGLQPVGFPAVVAALDPAALLAAQLGRQLALGLCRRRLVDLVEHAVEGRQRGVAADQLLHLALRRGAIEGGAFGRRGQGNNATAASTNTTRRFMGSHLRNERTKRSGSRQARPTVGAQHHLRRSATQTQPQHIGKASGPRKTHPPKRSSAPGARRRPGRRSKVAGNATSATWAFDGAAPAR